MKIITVIAEQVSPEALNAALPADGIIAVSVTETWSFSRTAESVDPYRGVKVAESFTPGFRIEMEVEDTAVGAAIEGIAFARSAGLFGDARVHLSEGVSVDVFAASRPLAA